MGSAAPSPKLCLPKTRTAHKSRGLPHLTVMETTDFWQFNDLPKFLSLRRKESHCARRFKPCAYYRSDLASMVCAFIPPRRG
jgi:hypothetical protein